MTKKIDPKSRWTWQADGMTVVRRIARTGPGCHEGCGYPFKAQMCRVYKQE